MDLTKTKDRRINIRLDEDTYFALKDIVENDLNTDISSYCRSLLMVSTLHEATLHKTTNAVKQFSKNKDMEDLEYMITIKNEIKFIEKFLMNIKENRKRYDDFIDMVETWYETMKTEVRRYFTIYNDIIEDMETILKQIHGDEYDTDPTISKPGSKIII